MHDTSLPTAVRVGGMDKPALAQALCEHSVHLNQAAEALFGDRRFTLLSEPTLVEIAVVSVSTLGFDDGAMWLDHCFVTPSRRPRRDANRLLRAAC